MSGLDRLIEIFKDHDVQIPCPGEQSCLLKYLIELRDWRTNPFKMIKEKCQSIYTCRTCNWDGYCNQEDLQECLLPEAWKFDDEESQ